MKMNKKKAAWMGAGVALSSMLVVSAAYAGLGEAPGYEAYKSAVKNTMKATSVTQQFNLSVHDNGTALLNASSRVKEDQSTGASSAEVVVSGPAGSEKLQLYSPDGGSLIAASGDDIYQFQKDMEKRWGHEGREHKLDPETREQLKAELENVMDQLAGGLKEKVKLSRETDGTQTVSLVLSGSEIPAALNTVGSLLLKYGVFGSEHSSRWEAKQLEFPAAERLEQLAGSLPKLTGNVRISGVELQAEVDAANRITEQLLKLTVTGQDANGAAHEVVLNAAAAQSDFDSTVPDTVDLTGKQVQTIEPGWGRK